MAGYSNDKVVSLAWTDSLAQVKQTQQWSDESVLDTLLVVGDFMCKSPMPPRMWVEVVQEVEAQARAQANEQASDQYRAARIRVAEAAHLANTENLRLPVPKVPDDRPLEEPLEESRVPVRPRIVSLASIGSLAQLRENEQWDRESVSSALLRMGDSMCNSPMPPWLWRAVAQEVAAQAREQAAANKTLPPLPEKPTSASRNAGLASRVVTCVKDQVGSLKRNVSTLPSHVSAFVKNWMPSDRWGAIAESVRSLFVAKASTTEFKNEQLKCIAKVNNIEVRKQPDLNWKSAMLAFIGQARWSEWYDGLETLYQREQPIDTIHTMIEQLRQPPNFLKTQGDSLSRTFLNEEQLEHHLKPGGSQPERLILQLPDNRGLVTMVKAPSGTAKWWRCDTGKIVDLEKQSLVSLFNLNPDRIDVLMARPPNHSGSMTKNGTSEKPLPSEPENANNRHSAKGIGGSVSGLFRSKDTATIKPLRHVDTVDGIELLKQPDRSWKAAMLAFMGQVRWNDTYTRIANAKPGSRPMDTVEAVVATLAKFILKKEYRSSLRATFTESQLRDELGKDGPARRGRMIFQLPNGEMVTMVRPPSQDLWWRCDTGTSVDLRKQSVADMLGLNPSSIDVMVV